MSKIDELINKLCPNGVEYKSIGSLIKRSREKAGDNQNVSQVYVVSNERGLVKAEEYRENTIHSEDTSNYLVVKKGMIAYNPSRLNIGSIAIMKDDIGLVSPMYVVFSVNFNLIMEQYFEYLLDSSYVKNKIDAYKEEGARFRFDFERWSWINIPVPPIEVQREIIRVLNTIKELSTELSAELKAREKQYDYYQTKLFDFSNEVEYLPLEKIAEIGTGSSNTNEAEDDGKYPFYVRSQQLYRKNTYEYDETAIITSGDGVGVGKIFHYVEGKYALHQRAYRIHITSEKVIPKYYYFYMRSTFYDYIMKNAFNSSVTSVRRPMLNKYPVPIPSIEEQERIIKILENFDKLSNDISEGLPAEIGARQKQYEYYRDKLLTFKELVNEG